MLLDDTVLSTVVIILAQTNSAFVWPSVEAKYMSPTSFPLVVAEYAPNVFVALRPTTSLPTEPTEVEYLSNIIDAAPADVPPN